jgi:hypothetical protein
MKLAALALFSLFAVAACEQRQGDESGRAVDAADTVVTSEQDVDTSIITQDTTVDVDTTQREGDEPVSSDTLQQSGQPADTGIADTATQ